MPLMDGCRSPGFSSLGEAEKHIKVKRLHGVEMASVKCTHGNHFHTYDTAKGDAGDYLRRLSAGYFRNDVGAATNDGGRVLTLARETPSAPCTKKSYGSAALANAHAAALGMSVYECTRCKHWHMTSAEDWVPITQYVETFLMDIGRKTVAETISLSALQHPTSKEIRFVKLARGGNLIVVEIDAWREFCATVEFVTKGGNDAPRGAPETTGSRQTGQ